MAADVHAPPGWPLGSVTPFEAEQEERDGANTGTARPFAMSAAPPRDHPPLLLTAALLVAAAACYVGIVTIRQGPPSGGDTVPLVAVTSAISTGQLHAAAANDGLPNPPGYALLVSPFVAALDHWVGSATWCTTVGRANTLRSGRGYLHDPTFATDVAQCGSPARLPDGTIGPGRPPWYRSQGLLGVLMWLVLAVGCLALLRASGADSLGREVGLLAFLAFLPAATSAIVQLYHPEDIASLGLGIAGLAQALRRRWVVAGALFGVACLTKQFAVLLFIPALATAMGARARLTLAGTGAVVFAAGIVPFFVSAPRATWENLSGFSAGGAVSGSTVLSLAGVTGSVASAVARDLPVLFAIGLSIWVGHRLAGRAITPERLVALGLACMASRLVFESVVFAYYLLGASVLYFLYDLVARRFPVQSLAWCAAAAFFVAVRPDNRAVDAFGTLLLATLAVVPGIREAARQPELPEVAPPPAT